MTGETRQYCKGLLYKHGGEGSGNSQAICKKALDEALTRSAMKVQSYAVFLTLAFMATAFIIPENDGKQRACIPRRLIMTIQLLAEMRRSFLLSPAKDEDPEHLHMKDD